MLFYLGILFVLLLLVLWNNQRMTKSRRSRGRRSFRRNYLDKKEDPTNIDPS